MKITGAKHGAAITVKVMPRARKTELAGLMDDGTLRIRLAAPPVGGAANRALVAFLAEALDLPPSQIDILAGETSQRKLVALVGIQPADVDAAIAALLAGDKSARTKPAGRRVRPKRG
jgi:uncharacterized protein (TIGR00251 family)